MNYRHIYHAGNFADVFKHWILTILISKLLEKPTPFFVLDTHAGIGQYKLTDKNAQKTAEYASGISKIVSKKLATDFQTYQNIVEPDYLQSNIYLGSPMIISRMLRPNDRLCAAELHPEDFTELQKLFVNDQQVKVLHENGYIAIKAQLPPKEKRGLILIDPPFEKIDEFDQILTAVNEGLTRFATGIYAIWYPIKDQHELRKFYRKIAKLPAKSSIAVELHTHADVSNALRSCGMIIINPPWQLDTKLQANMPKLLSNLELPDGKFMLQHLKREES